MIFDSKLDAPKKGPEILSDRFSLQRLNNSPEDLSRRLIGAR